jgi:hypothetical protein
LPLASKDEDAEHGLGFAFLRQLEGGPAVLTGHENGLITLNIAEADDPFRESTRESMGETYGPRTGGNHHPFASRSFRAMKRNHHSSYLRRAESCHQGPC